MASYEDDVFNLPVSGHYDCGYSYGTSAAAQPKPLPPVPAEEPVTLPIRQPKAIYTARQASISIARPISPPVTLPNSFQTQRQNSYDGSREDYSPRKQEFEDDSDLTSLSSHKASILSSHSSLSPTCSVKENKIEPDPLPMHSNQQHLSPTQSIAFQGPYLQPVKLGKMYVSDVSSGDQIFVIAPGKRIKLSKQFVHKVWDKDATEQIGTIAIAHGKPHEIALLKRAQDLVLQQESASSTKWCFRPSCLTKKGAFWYWYKDRLRGGIVLSESKKGSMPIARIQKDILSFERPSMSLDTVQEICLAAMALAALARTFVDEEDITNLATTMAVKAFGEAEEGSLEGDDWPEKQGIVRRLTKTLR